MEWERAKAVIIIASGAVYFVLPERPSEWRCVDSLGIECVVAADGNNAIVATYTDLLMIDSGGNTVWRRRLAIDGIEIAKVSEDRIEGRLCYDPPEGWSPFFVRRADGSDF